MQLVIDISALLAVLLDEEHRDRVVAAALGASLCGPASLPWEVGNALSASLKRRRFSLTIAQAAVEAYEQIPIRLLPVDLSDALALAATHTLYAYDAYFLVVCQKLRAPLLTLDRGLTAAAHAAGVTVIEV